MVSFTNPDGTQTDPEWFSDVDDSAPEPDVTEHSGTTDDGPTFTNPDGTQTDPEWFSDVDDTAPTPSDETIEDIRQGGDDGVGLLAGAGIGAAGLIVGLLAVVAAVATGGD